MRYHSPLPPLAELQKVLQYNSETGVFTRNGKVAGHVQHGRRKIEFKGKTYFASRLAWLWMTGEDPGACEVDHADLDRANDRWLNLRLATTQANSCNRRRWGRLTDLPKGVYQQGRKFVAKIRVNYRALHLGTFDTPEEAHAAYCKAAQEHFDSKFWRAS